ncbi:MAG: hypothetical protein F6J98_11695, partial [Moorea sp. SIO4G2]|nr:hypothetical protein [Moorena sp. SIO4G2]
MKRSEVLMRYFLLICQIVILAILVVAVPRGSWAHPTQMIQKQNITPKDLMGEPENAPDVDRISLPPLQTEFFSPQGDFRFTVSTPDKWKSTQGYGRLVRLMGNVSEIIWEDKLPQEYGPRYLLVGQQGEVLMLDEWINVKSKYAIVVLNPQNELIIQHDFDNVQEILDVPTSEIVQRATGGSWWLSGPPSLDESGSKAYIPTSDQVLKVDLQTGQLSLLNCSD